MIHFGGLFPAEGIAVQIFFISNETNVTFLLIFYITVYLCCTVILQRPRNIAADAGFETGLSKSVLKRGNHISNIRDSDADLDSYMRFSLNGPVRIRIHITGFKIQNTNIFYFSVVLTIYSTVHDYTLA